MPVKTVNDKESKALIFVSYTIGGVCESDIPKVFA